MAETKPEIQIVLPVHNEEECIETVLDELYDELSPRLSIQFVISEDGSQDRTKQILQELSHRLPMILIMDEQQKGYSQAVADAYRATTSDYILALDSDGQCSPKDFWNFYQDREKFDISMGWRRPRSDTLFRRVLSGGFKAIYQMLFRVPLHDPSCPYLLITKEVRDAVVKDMGTFSHGFWWEFFARAHSKGFKIREIPIQHRTRLAGHTKSYPLASLPGIAFTHVSGLFRIWRQVRKESR